MHCSRITVPATATTCQSVGGLGSEEFLNRSGPAGTYVIGPATNSISIDDVSSDSSPSCLGNQRDAHAAAEIDALWTRVRMGVVEIDYEAEGGRLFHVAWVRCLAD